MIVVEANISIKKDGLVILNPGKIMLLNEIKQCGSLNAAAKKLNLSYQHVWNMMNDMNRISPEPVVIKQRGGANGGGAEVSEYGLKILNEYKMIGRAVQKIINQINVEINI